MSDQLVTTETELLEVQDLQLEVLDATEEAVLLEVAEQGPPGIDGETIASAAVVGSTLVLTTNLGNTIAVAGSILGPVGPDGASAYDVAVANGFVGTELQWLASLAGAPGEPGADGNDGLDGSDGTDGRGIVSVARTAGTGAAGTTDTYTITFTDATTATFQVVNGANGANGAPGDPGEPGEPGSDGLSAYQIAVANGFVGTEAAWLESLVGEPGPPGPAAFQESSPVFSYTDGRVTRIDYASGNYKLFAYTAGVLTQLDHVRVGDTTIRKVFAYNPDGSLASIAQSEI